MHFSKKRNALEFISPVFNLNKKNIQNFDVILIAKPRESRMFNINNIKNFLAIKDNCIHLNYIDSKFVKGRTQLVVYGILTKDVSRCPNCGFPSFVDGRSMIVKNGNKVSRILMYDWSKQKVYLNHLKQRITAANVNLILLVEQLLIALLQSK